MSMSIPDLWSKIKGLTGIDNTTIMFLFILIGVGVASFGFGRLSVTNTNISGIPPSISLEKRDLSQVSSIQGLSSKDSNNNTENTPGKNYVASKHGKLYYTSTCAGAKRIKPENEVWFSTTGQAEQAGYLFASSCK